jgi:hypothetical protein
VFLDQILIRDSSIVLIPFDCVSFFVVVVVVFAILINLQDVFCRHLSVVSFALAFQPEVSILCWSILGTGL